MKKAEIILVSITLIGFVLFLLNINLDFVLRTCISITSIFYLIFSYFRFDDYNINQNKTEASKLNLPKSIIAGIAIAVLLQGFKMRLISWPGATITFFTGILAVIVVLVLQVIAFLNDKNKLNKTKVIRLSLFFIFGLFFLLTPKSKIVEIKYRNYPDYVKAYKEAVANPDSIELWNNVHTEFYKIKQNEIH